MQQEKRKKRKDPWCFALFLLFGSVIAIALRYPSHQLQRQAYSIVTLIALFTVASLWLVSLLSTPLLLASAADLKRSQGSQRRTRVLQRPRLTMIHLPSIQRNIDHSKEHVDVKGAFNDVLHLIIRDFVHTWHGPLLSGGLQIPLKQSSNFPTLLQSSLQDSFERLEHTILKLDSASMFIQRLLPVITKHMEEFDRAKVSLRGSHDVHLSKVEQDDVFLAAKYCGGSLHPAVSNTAATDTSASELMHLRKVTDQLLPIILSPDDLSSPALTSLIREIVACTVLKPCIDNLSSPETLNDLIESKTSSVLREQQLVNRLRNALDMQDALSKQRAQERIVTESSQPVQSVPKLSKDKSGQSFDHFVQNVSQLDSLLEARQMRSSLEQHLRNAKSSMNDTKDFSGSSNKIDGEFESRRLDVYVGRLEKALHTIDRRIKVLQPKSTSPHLQSISPRNEPDEEFVATVKFDDILLSTSAVSYFVEFMERRQRSVLIQFWLSVEGFKDPLEIVEDHKVANPGYWTPSQSITTLQQDLLHFAETYFTSETLASVVRQKDRDTMLLFVNANVTQMTDVELLKKARQSILVAQRDVYIEMSEDDWILFKMHSTWNKAVSVLHQEQNRPSCVTQQLQRSQDEMEEKEPEQTSVSLRNPVFSLRQNVDLFGGSSDSQLRPVRTNGLFDVADEEEPGMMSPSSVQASFEQLLGGKGGTFDSAFGREPLFREALFDEDVNETDDDDMSHQKSGIQRIDKIDAVEQALTQIIHEDIPVASRDLLSPEWSYPSIRRSSNSAASMSSNKSIGSSTPATTSLEREDRGVNESSSGGALNKPLDTSTGMSQLARCKEMDQINALIKHLVEQDDILAALQRKSELTGSSVKESRLLDKSRSAVQRELREAKLKRVSLNTSDAQLGTLQHQKTAIHIEESIQRLDEDGKEYILYPIHVSIRRAPSEGSSSYGWIVSRRYNEFHLLHSRLREKFGQARSLESHFPGKRIVGLMSKQMLESRRQSLEKYLQALLGNEALCYSEEFRVFLSRSTPVFTSECLRKHLEDGKRFGPKGNNLRLFETFRKGVTGVAGSLDDLLFGPSTYELLANCLASGASDMFGAKDVGRALLSSSAISPTNAEMDEAASVVPGPSSGQIATATFAECICDAFVELFQLNLEDHWLRRQAIVIVLQQALGGTIERKARQVICSSLSSTAICLYLNTFRNQLWPNRVLRKVGNRRTTTEKEQLGENALQNLCTFFSRECFGLVLLYIDLVC